MKEQDVTIMEWINENWGWLVAIIGFGVELVRGHFRISELENDMGKLESKLDMQTEKQEELVKLLARIEGKIEMIVSAIQNQNMR